MLSNVLAFSIFNALLIIALYRLFGDKFNFNKILNLPLSMNSTDQLVEIACIGAALTLIGSINMKLLMASLQNVKLSRFQLFIVFGTNTGLVITSTNSNPLLAMLFVALVLPNIIGFCCLVVKIWLDSSIRISFRYISHSVIWDLIRNGQLFFFMQFAAVINYQVDAILISYFLNPSQVAEYSVVLKIASIPFILISSVVFQIWGQTASFLALSEFNSAYKNLVQNLLRVTQFSSLAMVVFIIFGQSYIRVWTGNQISPSMQLVLANAIWIPISCIMQVFAMFLNGAKETKFLVVTTLLFTTSNLGLAFYFLKFEGNISGPMWSNSISALVFFVLPAFLLGKRFKSKFKDSNSG